MIANIAGICRENDALLQQWTIITFCKELTKAGVTLFELKPNYERAYLQKKKSIHYKDSFINATLLYEQTLVL